MVPAVGYPGISLRQPERADLVSWYAYLSKPEVVQHTNWNLRSGDDLVPMFEAFESTTTESARHLAIVSDADGQLVGTIGFHTISEVNRTAEIAYDLAPSPWERGIATAVCRHVTAWSFVEYGFVRVQAMVLDSNHRSARVLQKSHLRYEGGLRACRMVRGVPCDFDLYSRLATD